VASAGFPWHPGNPHILPTVAMSFYLTVALLTFLFLVLAFLLYVCCLYAIYNWFSFDEEHDGW
jgi:hypothetical protein